MILLLDVGNTRLKWAWLEDGRAGPARAVQHHGAATAWQAELEGWQAALEAEGRSPERILASNVAGGPFARTLGGWSKARFGFWPEFAAVTASAHGVTIAYATPSALGADRWLGLVAARDAGEGPACIVNAGTAVTIDALDAGGRQLGGFILPGLKLMEDALYSRTQNVAPAAAAEPPAARGFFAVNTAGAVQLGPLLAVAALADRTVTELMRAGEAEPRLLLTGGDAERVQPHLLRPASHVPDLVIAGLAVLARQSSS